MATMEEADVEAVMEKLLDECGIRAFEPTVTEALVYLAAENAEELIGDSVKFAKLLKDVEAKDLTVEDVQFADRMKRAKYQREFDKEEWSRLIEERNSTPLTMLNLKKSISLPPERHCLLMANYRASRNVTKISESRATSSKFLGQYRSEANATPRKRFVKPPAGDARSDSASPSSVSSTGSVPRIVRPVQPSASTSSPVRPGPYSSIFKMVVNSDSYRSASSTSSANPKCEP